MIDFNINLFFSDLVKFVLKFQQFLRPLRFVSTQLHHQIKKKKETLSETVSKGFGQAPHKENIQMVNKQENALNLINNQAI